MKYQNKKNGKVAELVQESEKYKTVLLVYEDGTDTTISTSTLKRWWKKLPKQEVVEVTPDPVETVPEEKTENELVQMPGTDGNWGEEHWASEEDVAGDGTPLAEVGKEIAAQAKERAKQIAAGKKARKPKEKTPDRREERFVSFLNWLESQECVTKIRRRGVAFVAVKVNNKAALEIRLPKSNGGSIYTKASLMDKCKLQGSLVNNYYLPVVIKLEDDTKLLETMKTIIEQAEKGE